MAAFIYLGGFDGVIQILNLYSLLFLVTPSSDDANVEGERKINEVVIVWVNKQSVITFDPEVEFQQH